MDQPLMNCCSTRPNAPNWDSFAQDGRGPFPLPAGLGRLVRKGFSATSGRQGLRHEAEANLCASGGARSRSFGCVRPCRARLRKRTRTQRKRTWCPPHRTPCRQERLVATEFGVGFPRCRQRACWPSRRGRSVGPPHFAGARPRSYQDPQVREARQWSVATVAMASRRGHPAGDSCGSGSWGGRCPSLADYVAGMSPRAGRSPPDGCWSWLRSGSVT